MESADLALIMCPGWGAAQPPVGISYLKGYLNSFGIRTKCFDLSIELYLAMQEKKYWDLNYPAHFIDQALFERDIVPSLMSYIEKWSDRILSFHPKMVGFSLFMSSVNASIVLARHLKAKRPDLILIGGGPEVARLKLVVVDKVTRVAAMRQEVLLDGIFDILIVGEGEILLRELVMARNRGEDVYKVDGILYLRDGIVVENKPGEALKCLDVMAPPDYSDFKVGSYAWKSLPLVTSRGCVNRCTFCADSPLWKQYRFCSAEKVVADIRFLMEKHNVTEFEFTDSIFNGNMRRVEEICELIIKSGLKIRWSAKAALKKEMDFNLLEKMRKAGCMSLGYGVESGSPRVLVDMRKNIDPALASRIIRDTFRAGIQANCFFIVGYPTETEEDFLLTLDFIKQNARFIHSFNQVTGCHIEEDSHLGHNMDEYGIMLKGDGWYSRDSTPEIRTERLQRFRNLARSLHNHYQCEVQA